MKRKNMNNITTQINDNIVTIQINDNIITMTTQEALELTNKMLETLGGAALEKMIPPSFKEPWDDEIENVKPNPIHTIALEKTILD